MDCGCGHHHGHGRGWGRCCEEGFEHRSGFGFGWFGRRFLTREERISNLEEYLHALQAEAKAVEEHIAELKAAR
jgi:hypothetical protein